MTDTNLPATLEEAQAWDEVDRCVESTGRFFWRIGQALIAAKEKTPHGQWLTRLAEREIGEDAAERWMRVAREMTEAEFVEAGSLRRALAQLSTPAELEAADSARERNIDDEPEADEPEPESEPSPRPESRAHPATYTKGLLPIFADIIATHLEHDFGATKILDPMAGEGSIFDLRDELHRRNRRGIIIEASDVHPWHHGRRDHRGDRLVQTADATALEWDDEDFDVIVTSPPYGNRMADKLSVDGDHRHTYADRRGEDAGPTDTSGMQWGNAYRTTMATIWAELFRVLRGDGLLILNCKDHIRDGHYIDVTGFNAGALVRLDLVPVATRFLVTPGVQGVENADARTPGEYVIAFRKPVTS